MPYFLFGGRCCSTPLGGGLDLEYPTLNVRVKDILMCVFIYFRIILIT